MPRVKIDDLETYYDVHGSIDELDEDDDICPTCGGYVEEPAYDIEDDLADEDWTACMCVPKSA